MTIVDSGKLQRAFLHPKTGAQQAHEKAQKTAQQFEEIMVRTFVGALRKTTSIGEESGGMFGSGPGSDTFTDWFDEKVAHEISDTGRVGVAEVLMQEFERTRASKPKAEANTKQLRADAKRDLLDLDVASLRQHDHRPLQGRILDVAL